VDKLEIDVISSYRTDHLYLAAFLTCSGYRIVGTSREGSRVCFVFDQTFQLSAAVASFMAGAAIPARQYAFEVLKLKKLIPRSKPILETVNYATEKSAP
jgi:hypothetical protein